MLWFIIIIIIMTCKLIFGTLEQVQIVDIILISIITLDFKIRTTIIL